MFHRPSHNWCVAIPSATFLAVLCLFPAEARGQEAEAVIVKFAFGLSAVDTRFEQVTKPEVEKDISAELARSCAKKFPFWNFQSTADDLPRVEVWLSLKNSEWSLNVALVHAPGKLLKDKWLTVLYAPGDLDTQVLPKDRAWTSRIKTTFEDFLQGDGQNEILNALEEFAPLGNQMAPVPAQATAVLSLEYRKYQVLSLSAFRIMCQWNGHGVVVLHSTGTGAPNDFPPNAPLNTPTYKGIWVLHNKWEFAGRSEEILPHMSDLRSLTALKFYLEQVNSPPPSMQVSVMP